MQYIIEIKKHENKDYTVFIYEGVKVFPVFAIKKPLHWNKCVKGISGFLQAKKMINVFQKKSFEENLIQQFNEEK